MIVWKGRGILAIIVFIAMMFLFISILPERYSDLSFVFSFFISGAFSWIFGNKWNKREERILIDEKSGQKFKFKSKHELFWIPLQYFGMILIFLGMVILFQNSILFGLIASVFFVALIFYQFKDKILNTYKINKSENPKPQNEKKVFENKAVDEISIRKTKDINEMNEEELREYYKRFMPK